MVKSLIALKHYVHSPTEKKPKYCSTSGSLATIKAYFDVGDGATMIEKYCDDCTKRITYRA